MQVCTLLQTDNHASTSPLSFLQAGCPSCRPTNSVKALKAKTIQQNITIFNHTNDTKLQTQQQPPQFYGHHTGQPVLAGTSS